eukprot:CAMPEP_0203785546 /NCGR_PEP_ID=MMETSP0100_2-20121128/1095_1 /ASSEMBLY_ACC=CAM_ASM_000210 /TAXON_ID=96639 /ORGANISM=" , Strain NY0313808BC1" /LENGTH=97 /DNA_ID=CAMNT_0050687677 /DNA_START=93 /DNA_END=383 /DNA_ORIENTATION=-
MVSVIGYRRDPYYRISEPKSAVFSRSSLCSSRRKVLKLDVKETKTGYELKADVPGVPKDNVDVLVEDGVLTINVDHEQENPGDEETIHWNERTVGRV